MVTQLAQVRVTKVEAGNGYLIKCSCGATSVRLSRRDADALAVTHQRLHVTPDPIDHIADL